MSVNNFKRYEKKIGYYETFLCPACGKECHRLLSKKSNGRIPYGMLRKNAMTCGKRDCQWEYKKLKFKEKYQESKLK